MSPIAVLPKHVVNRIAAGEVVERPASVVKELVENSLDAGATRITVEIEDGGKRLIRITDDGSGIAAEDMPLAFASHATSKIATDDDLSTIATLGFRGEALASIASVSQLDAVSRRPSAIEAVRIEISGGLATEPAPASGPVGTTICVRNLFFNTPARRKFLRTTNTEMGHVTEQFTRIALAHGNVAFSLTHNDRILQDLPADQPLTDRIAALFSAELADALLNVQRTDQQVSLSGLVARPAQARSASQWQYVFVNGRFVRDRFVSHAIREAYRSMLPPNRQAVVFLFLSIDPSQVDVNVHPAKTEVRFANSNLIHSQVLAAIRDRLLSTDMSVPISTQTLQNSPDQPHGADTQHPPDPTERDARRQRVRQAMVDFFESSRSKRPETQHQPPKTTRPPSDKAPPRMPAPASPGVPTRIVAEQAPLDRPTPPLAYRDRSTGQSDHSRVMTSRFLQVHNSYLITESDDGIVIIDQHALHERGIYERLCRQVAGGPLPSQRSLIPETLDVTDAQAAAIENNSQLLNDLGIIVEPFGPRTVAVQGVPALLDKVSGSSLLADILDVLTTQTARLGTEQLLHHLLDMMACKAAVKAGDRLTDTEIEDLLASRQTVERSGNCPHGRPTTISLTLGELAKYFKRT